MNQGHSQRVAAQETEISQLILSCKLKGRELHATASYVLLKLLSDIEIDIAKYRIYYWKRSSEERPRRCLSVNMQHALYRIKRSSWGKAGLPDLLDRIQKLRVKLADGLMSNAYKLCQEQTA